MIRVALIEDAGKTRETWALLLNETPGFHCVAAYGTAEEALARLPATGVDVVLVDLRLPRMDGCGFIRELKRQQRKLLICVLTTYEDTDLIFASLRAGASGYLLKKTPPARILEGIQELTEGGAPMSPAIARKVTDFFNRVPSPADAGKDLTRREREVLELLAQGLADKGIATRLKVSIYTVRNHVSSIYSKLHVHTRAEATAKHLGQ